MKNRILMSMLAISFMAPVIVAETERREYNAKNLDERDAKEKAFEASLSPEQKEQAQKACVELHALLEQIWVQVNNGGYQTEEKKMQHPFLRILETGCLSEYDNKHPERLKNRNRSVVIYPQAPSIQIQISSEKETNYGVLRIYEDGFSLYEYIG